MFWITNNSWNRGNVILITGPWKLTERNLNSISQVISHLCTELVVGGVGCKTEKNEILKTFDVTEILRIKTYVAFCPKES